MFSVEVRCEECDRRFPGRTPTTVGIVAKLDDPHGGPFSNGYNIMRARRHGTARMPSLVGSGSAVWDPDTFDAADADPMSSGRVTSWRPVDKNRDGKPRIDQLRCGQCGHGVRHVGLDGLLERAESAAACGQQSILA